VNTSKRPANLIAPVSRSVELETPLYIRKK
jgi:hypothetical protein